MGTIMSNPVAIIALALCVILIIILLVKGFKKAFQGAFAFVTWLLFIGAIVLLVLYFIKK
jgi:Ca2+/H+ antiporter